MNDEHMPAFSDISNGVKIKVEQRSERRAVVINAVELARTHADRLNTQWTQQDADVVMAITELLDRVAGA